MRHEDLGMTAEVYKESITPPPILDLDDIKGNIMKEVLQGKSDVDAVTVQGWIS